MTAEYTVPCNCVCCSHTSQLSTLRHIPAVRNGIAKLNAIVAWPFGNILINLTTSFTAKPETANAKKSTPTQFARQRGSAKVL